MINDFNELKRIIVEKDMIKKNENQNLPEIYKKNFLLFENCNDYIEFTEDKEINDFLNDRIVDYKRLNGCGNLFLGKLFKDTYDYLTDKNTECDTTYTKFLESIGSNKMTALRYRKRYEIFQDCKSDSSKSLMSIINQKLIDEIFKIKENDNDLYNILIKCETQDELISEIDKNILEMKSNGEIENKILSKSKEEEMLILDEIKEFDGRTDAEAFSGIVKMIEHDFKFIIDENERNEIFKKIKKLFVEINKKIPELN